MEFRQLGHSGLKVPLLTFGTGTFGGRGEFFSAWGNSDVTEATRLVNICFDAGQLFRYGIFLFPGRFRRNPGQGDSRPPQLWSHHQNDRSLWAMLDRVYSSSVALLFL
jgi:hypothetical protein